jgi:hypothetical protein
LLWPEGIVRHMDDAHLESVLAHEVCHVRRRDNLTSAIHMLVEALFWFHPVVWWMERQLVKERECACDEAVLQLGNEAAVYAESILDAEFRCEVCGLVSINPTRWFMMRCGDSELTVHRWDPDAAKAVGARHYCGEAHAGVYMSRWFESVRTPPTASPGRIR